MPENFATPRAEFKQLGFFHFSCLERYKVIDCKRMGCPTSQDGLYYGLISSSECSGQGQCINATGYSSHFDALCVCNSLYSGESDMFDLRVARLPDGTWLSLDCPNPRIGVYVIWSAQLLFLCCRELLILRAMFSQFRYKGRLTLKAALSYMPYRVLAVDGFIAGVILLGLPIQKLLPEGLVIGTDIGPTLCLVLGTLFGTLAYNDFEFAQFRALVKASSMDFAMHKQLLRRQRTVLGVTHFAYCFFSLVPSVVALRLDKSLGPIQNQEYVTLVLRNIGIIIWLSCQWIADVFMQREIRAIVGALVQVGSTGGSTSVLDYLNKHAAVTKSTAASACVIWLLFSLPVSHIFLYNIVFFFFQQLMTKRQKHFILSNSIFGPFKAMP